MKYLILFYRRKTTTTCTKEDIDTCKENFGTFQDVVDYDCKGQCKMCKWCSLAPTLKECKLYCSEGVQGCTNSCVKGRAKCLTCGKNFQQKKKKEKEMNKHNFLV